VSGAETEALEDGRQSPAALRIARGTRRFLRNLDMTTLTEVPLRSNRRADLVAVGPKGEIWIIEIKSSVADFRADTKWPDYRQHCDRFFFATALDVPVAIFPSDAGLIIGDGFSAAVEWEAPLVPLASATRKELLVRLGRLAADRLHALQDPALPL